MTLALAYSEEEITNERLQYVLDMHRTDITQMLSRLCAQKYLESTGYGRGTKYHIYGLSNVALTGANIGLPDANIGLPDANIELPDANIGLSDANIGLSVIC
ncbi:MAG: hypothetical protein IKW46_07735 [Bacteroidaceae bacterium]|nr:hypothetical protein [Bacteroidaceae bacterium]